MAFKRTCVVQPSEPIRLYSTYDEAVRCAPDKLLQYWLSGGDLSLVEVVGTPAVFHVLPLSPDQAREVHLAKTSHKEHRAQVAAGAFRAFDLCCRLITDWEHEDGTIGALPREQWKECVPIAAQEEIGTLIINLSEPGPKTGK